jgi:lipopolysaccharide transport system ATP-binding protein
MNDADVLVECKGVSKKFARTLKKSLLYGFNDISSAMLGKQGVRKLRPDEFWAVKDVSFQLKRGECLGLIGHNGAGKSTLLKILNGLIRPDEGEIIVRGRVGALIELGAGFNPILSGRENIYINGQILGFTKQEINDKLDAIIEFSEIGEFIDTPVQNYSSGMKVRLGFAVAAQMEPDVLIIDEVLAVGDLGFRIKCLNRISELMSKTSVIFVSHTMPQVARVSTSVLLMTNGRCEYIGPTPRGIEMYQNSFDNEEKSVIGDGIRITRLNAIESKKDEIHNIVEMRNDVFDVSNPPQIHHFSHGNSLKISAELESKEFVNELTVSLTIFDKDQKPVAISYLLIKEIEANERKSIDFSIDDVQLAPGHYILGMIFYKFLNNRPITICNYRMVLKINVVGAQSFGHAPIYFKTTILK